MTSLKSEIKKSVVNGYALSKLQQNDWTRCYFQPYSHGTKIKDIISSCPIDDNVYLFVCALSSSSSKSAYVGAFCPSSILTTETTSNTEALKPEKFKSDNEYKVYWYNCPKKSFGFAPTSKISLSCADTADENKEQRLSWHLSGSGGWRAGSKDNLNDDNVWYKAVYYKRFDEETEGTTMKERMDKVERMLTDLQQSVMQITKEVSGLKSRISEESKNDDTPDLYKEIQSLRKDMNALKEATSSLSTNKEDVQEMKSWMTNTVGLPQYINLFIENGFDRLSIIQNVGMNELQEMGMDKRGHMLSIVKEIQKLSVAK